MMDFEQRKEDLLTDNTSGAGEILEAALALLESMNGADVSFDEMAETAASLRQAHPSMAQIINLACDIEEICRAESREEFNAFLAQTSERRSTRSRNTAGHAADFLQGRRRIYTLSRSSLLERALLLLPPGPQIVIAESRPLNEGVTLAGRLAKVGHDVVVVADAALPGLIGGEGVAIVGCDAMLPAVVINKIGTYPLALACQRRNVPLAVLCHSGKMLRSPRDRYFVIAAQAGDELLADPPPGVATQNRYFEPTPKALFTDVIGEDGRRPNCESSERL